MNSSSNVSADQDVSVAEAVRRLRRDWSGQAQVALILGSGLGELAEKVNAEAVFEYHVLPHFPRSTALAHKGRLVCGTLGGVSVVTMQGRCHLYEGYSVDETTVQRVYSTLAAVFPSVETWLPGGADMIMAALEDRPQPFRGSRQTVKTRPKRQDKCSCCACRPASQR